MLGKYRDLLSMVWWEMIRKPQQSRKGKFHQYALRTCNIEMAL